MEWSIQHYTSRCFIHLRDFQGKHVVKSFIDGVFEYLFGQVNGLYALLVIHVTEKAIWLSMFFSHPSNRDATKTFHDSDPCLNVPSTSSANQKFILPPSQSQFFIVFQFLRNPIGEEDWQLTLERLVVLQFPEVSISDVYIYKVSKIYTPPKFNSLPLKSYPPKR